MGGYTSFLHTAKAESALPPTPPSAARSPRLQDFLLVALFILLAANTSDHDPSEVILIVLLGALQITESRFIPLETVRRRAFWNLLKLAVAYLLIGYTGGVESPYYLILLFPVISAAATMGVFSTLVFTALACGAYLSFLFFIDWNVFRIGPEQVNELGRRVIILAISGLLVNTLAEALRTAYRTVRLAEAQVRRSERLAALGQLTAGLAHELRNPLGTIKASAEMLQGSVAAAPPVSQELAGYISSEVDRTNALVSRFLDFARPLELQRSKDILGNVIAAAIRAADLEAARAEVRLESESAPEKIEFAFDAQLLERAIFNLVQNAIQASPPGSVVKLQARRLGSDAEIQVSDSGPGVAPKHHEEIFNPFFTTKSNGTGLGLAIVAKIVSEHGGRVIVDSAAGGGSTFTIFLPMGEQP
jgi:signal transduction histidine kinase